MKFVLQLLQSKNKLAKDDEGEWHIGQCYPFACYILKKKPVLYQRWIKAYTKTTRLNSVTSRVNLSSLSNRMSSTIHEAIAELRKTETGTEDEGAEIMKSIPLTAFGYYD